MRDNAEDYRKEWAGRTGRADNDIYIPEALREPEADNPTAKFELKFDDDTVVVELEFKFSDNADEFLDVALFVELASTQLLQSMVG